MSPFAYWDYETKWKRLRVGTRTGTPLRHVMLGLRVLLTDARNVPLRLFDWLYLAACGLAKSSQFVWATFERIRS